MNLEQLEQRLRRELARGMAVVALMLSVPGPVRAGGEPARPAVPKAADGINAIAWDLVRAEGPGNAVVSPSSIWEALAMLHQGAPGQNGGGDRRGARSARRPGLYRTPERQPDDPSDWLRVIVTPERRLLVVSQGGRTVTLRKVHTVLLDASSVVDPSVRDGVSIRVETR